MPERDDRAGSWSSRCLPIPMPSEPVACTWAPGGDGRNFTEDTSEPQAYEERSFTEYGKTRRRQPGAYPVQNAARKCTFCSYLLEQATLPACITTRIGGAMNFGDGNDPSILVNEVTLGQRIHLARLAGCGGDPSGRFSSTPTASITSWRRLGALNILIGNLDWKGVSHTAGAPTEKPRARAVLFNSAIIPPPLTPFGIDIIRGGAFYEKSTIFNGYPAKRPWYPMAGDVYQEVNPMAGGCLPQPHQGSVPVHGIARVRPARGHSLIPILRDPDKIPLIVSSNITIGETTLYAHYRI